MPISLGESSIVFDIAFVGESSMAIFFKLVSDVGECGARVTHFFHLATTFSILVQSTEITLQSIAAAVI